MLWDEIFSSLSANAIVYYVLDLATLHAVEIPIR